MGGRPSPAGRTEFKGKSRHRWIEAFRPHQSIYEENGLHEYISVVSAYCSPDSLLFRRRPSNSQIEAAALGDACGRKRPEANSTVTKADHERLAILLLGIGDEKAAQSVS
jgi:hypothetical protein